MKRTQEQMNEHIDNNDGYCLNCDSFTTSEVEPDAEEYECPECGKNSVMGAENALLLEHIEITDEEEDEDPEEDDEDFDDED